MIRKLSFVVAFSLAFPATSFAQDAEPEFDLFGKGAARLIERFLRELTPEFEKLKDEFKSLDRYEPPEVLPNGDIIIRRKRAPETPRTPRRDGGPSSQDEAIET